MLFRYNETKYLSTLVNSSESNTNAAISRKEASSNLIVKGMSNLNKAKLCFLTNQQTCNVTITSTTSFPLP